jgi:hypothetical protein
VLKRLAEVLRHAFAIPDPEELTDLDKAQLNRVCEEIVRRRLAGVAIIFLESARPMNFVGAQLLHFLHPLLSGVITPLELDKLGYIIQKRSSIPYLIECIERVSKEGWT